MGKLLFRTILLPVFLVAQLLLVVCRHKVLCFRPTIAQLQRLPHRRSGRYVGVVGLAGAASNNADADPTYTSVADLLADKAIPHDSGIEAGLYSVPCKLIKDDKGYYSNAQPQLQRPITDTCYYAAKEDTVQFRHGGKWGKAPPKLFLVRRDLANWRVSLFLAGSGGGKTADIVGTAASRGMSLTLVLRFCTDIQGKDMQKFIGARNKAARKMVADEIRDVLKRIKALKSVIDYVKAHDELQQDFGVAVGIDEAGSCPLLAQGIIGSPVQAKAEVQKALGLTGLGTPVVFSIGGAGGSRGSKGSMGSTFEILPTSFSVKAQRNAEILDHFVDCDPTPVILPGCAYSQRLHSYWIREHFPVVYELVSSNGRMASILVEVLKSKRRNNSATTSAAVEISESSLFKDMMDAFIKSNSGLRTLCSDNDDDRRRIVAAKALAVHLFSWKEKDLVTLPSDEDKMEQWALKFVCGIDFADGGSVGPLVTDYGLVEPRLNFYWMMCNRAHCQYVMSPAHMLVALYMLDLDLNSTTDEPNKPLGWFEFLSAHIVKCAIAAAITLKEGERPSIHAALAEIGFMVDEETSQAAKNQFESMKERIPIPHESSSPYYEPDNEYFHTTLPTKVGIMDTERKQKHLLMDKNHSSALKGMVAGGDFSSPVAAINCGNNNGPMGDGFVSFMSKRRGGGPTESIQKTTVVVIRANNNVDADDSSNNSPLPIGKLTRRCKQYRDDPAFTGTFGNTTVVNAMHQKKSFIKFPFDHRTGILPDLLAELSRRSITKRDS